MGNALRFPTGVRMAAKGQTFGRGTPQTPAASEFIGPGRDKMKEMAMKDVASSWLFWAVLSAVFAALTAIFAKIGIENVGSDYATFIRTLVILAVIVGILLATGGWQDPRSVSGGIYLFLCLSGAATGASWLCYFRALKLGDAARVAPIDKLSVILVAIFGVVILGEKLATPNWIGVALIAAGAVLVAYRG